MRVYVSHHGPFGLKRGDMKSDNIYRNNRSDKTYRIHLVKAFGAVSDDAADPAAPIDNSKHDGFHHRVTPIETFVQRIAKAVGDHGGDASLIFTQRLPLAERHIEKKIALYLGNDAFIVSDPWAAPIQTPSTTHDENRLFLESAQAGVTGFSKAVAARWPAVSDELSSELRRLENRLRANCHGLLRRAERMAKQARYRAFRTGLSSVPDSGPAQ